MVQTGDILKLCEQRLHIDINYKRVLVVFNNLGHIYILIHRHTQYHFTILCYAEGKLLLIKIKTYIFIFNVQLLVSQTALITYYNFKQPYLSPINSYLYRSNLHRNSKLFNCFIKHAYRNSLSSPEFCFSNVVKYQFRPKKYQYTGA